MDFKQIMALVIILIAIGFVFYWVINILFWLLLKIYHLLLKIPWFAKLVQQIQYWITHDTPEEKRLNKWARKWWKQHKSGVDKLIEFTSEMLLDPLFYGYALVVVVDRIRAINQYAQSHPEYSFSKLLDVDMTMDINFYLVFGAIFTLWMFGKVWKHNQDVKEKKTLNSNLEKMNKLLKSIDSKLGNKVDTKEDIENKEE